MRAAPLALAFGCLFAVAVGCGGDSGSDGSTTAPSGEAKSRPAPPKADFPAAEGRSLEAILELADSPSELLVSPAAKVFYEGMNRFPFGVLERGGAEVRDAEVALYLAQVPPPSKQAKQRVGDKGPVAQAQVEALEGPAIGPFPASIEALAPAHRAKTTGLSDPATVVYASSPDFPRDGEWRVAALIKEGDELAAKLLPSVAVGEFQRLPRPGQQAPLIHTLKASSQVDYADVLGKRPVVLLFATPKFCQSQVCGPVVDVAEQAKHEYGEKAAFIHMDIYNDNDPGRGVRPQVRTFRLPSEPWLFTIDRRGEIVEAIEGSFGPELMTEAVERVVAR
jgi:hypothetical protein